MNANCCTWLRHTLDQPAIRCKSHECVDVLDAHPCHTAVAMLQDLLRNGKKDMYANEQWIQASSLATEDVPATQAVATQSQRTRPKCCASARLPPRKKGTPGFEPGTC